MKKILFLLLVATTACATSIERLVEHTQDKVVKIGIVVPEGRGTGSGVFIDNHGTVLTCAHVVNHTKNGGKIFIKRNDGTVTRGTVIRINDKRDLALVATDLRNTPFMKIGYPVVRGQQVLAFGSPFGEQHSVAVGYVMNLFHKERLYVYHSAFILPGSSGGPLVDLRGRLVGLNEAMMMFSMFSPAPGYCVAIDIEEIKAFLRVE